MIAYLDAAFVVAIAFAIGYVVGTWRNQRRMIDWLATRLHIASGDDDATD